MLKKKKMIVQNYTFPCVCLERKSVDVLTDIFFVDGEIFVN